MSMGGVSSQALGTRETFAYEAGFGDVTAAGNNYALGSISQMIVFPARLKRVLAGMWRHGRRPFPMRISKSER